MEAERDRQERWSRFYVFEDVLDLPRRDEAALFATTRAKAAVVERDGRIAGKDEGFGEAGEQQFLDAAEPVAQDYDRYGACVWGRCTVTAMSLPVRYEVVSISSGGRSE